MFDNLGISERKDFTRVLPKYLSQHIFSYLSPKDLSRCSQVSSHWKYVSEQDEIWMPKCLKFGWYLPYTPSSRELGAWKSHYIDCVNSINAKPLSKVYKINLIIELPAPYIPKSLGFNFFCDFGDFKSLIIE